MPRTPFALIAHPTAAQLAVWWDTMQADPDLAFLPLPATLDAFIDRVQSGTFAHHCLISTGQAIAASFWLHDVQRTPHQVTAGWLACWIAAQARGASVRALWHLAHDYLHGQGVSSVFVATPIDHQRARCLANWAGLTPCGVMPGIRSDSQGRPVDAALYSLNATDVAHTWQAARTRAAQTTSTSLPLVRSHDPGLITQGMLAMMDLPDWPQCCGRYGSPDFTVWESHPASPQPHHAFVALLHGGTVRRVWRLDQGQLHDVDHWREGVNFHAGVKNDGGM